MVKEKLKQKRNLKAYNFIINHDMDIFFFCWDRSNPFAAEKCLFQYSHLTLTDFNWNGALTHY
jgi:hypothetical protein